MASTIYHHTSDRPARRCCGGASMCSRWSRAAKETSWRCAPEKSKLSRWETEYAARNLQVPRTRNIKSNRRATKLADDANSRTVQDCTGDKKQDNRDLRALAAEEVDPMLGNRGAIQVGVQVCRGVVQAAVEWQSIRPTSADPTAR